MLKKLSIPTMTTFVFITSTLIAQPSFAIPTHSTPKWQDIYTISWSTDKSNWGDNDLTVGDTVYFKFNMHKLYDGTHYKDLLKAWIDIDNDGNYEESESVFFSHTVHSSSTPNTGEGTLVNQDIDPFYSTGFTVTEDNIENLNIMVRVTCSESLLSSANLLKYWSDQWNYNDTWFNNNFGSDGHLSQGEVEYRRIEVNPVPEPATMVLFGAGLLGIASFGRRKNN